MRGDASPTPTVCAGVVEAAPPGSRFTVGQRVAGYTDRFGTSGTWAQLVAIPEAHLAPLPDNVPLVDGAAVSTVGVTAVQMFKKLGPAPPGATVLVNGAAGGVGSLLVQLAKEKGLRVVATASSKNADKASVCSLLGAVQLGRGRVARSQASTAEHIQSLCAGQGAGRQ